MLGFAQQAPMFWGMAQGHQQIQLSQQTNFEPSHRGKKSKQDYSNAICAVCNAPADGLHYGAISCRSCNAFFRRAVTFKQNFVCRKGGDCDVDVSVRCACRACRLQKCKAAGMRECDVQPKRDPTGSQKNRRAPERKRTLFAMMKKEVVDSKDGVVGTQFEHSPNGQLPSVESLHSEKGFFHCQPMEENPYQTILSPSCATYPPSTESLIHPPSEDSTIQFIKTIKKEEINEEEDIKSEKTTKTISERERNGQKGEKDSQKEFEELVHDYGEHLKWMNRAMIPIESFLSEEHGSCSKWRVMEPMDVEQLSKVELSGLMYWIEKQHPFRRLEKIEREALFQRYSVRKLSLDHFYTASKYPELIKEGHFGMLNNTYVPPDRTGFETVNDDKHTREAKFQVIRPTLDRLWHTIVLPFSRMEITDAEIVVLQLMLLWSSSHNRLVSEGTQKVMRERREWAMQSLYRHYQEKDIHDPCVRLGEILLLLPELEVICDIHCKDFQVAQLFELSNMSDYWYENYCYTNLNIE